VGVDDIILALVYIHERIDIGLVVKS